MHLSKFQEVLRQLGANDIERAKVLGVSERTVRLWREQEPRIIRIIAAHPVLAHALAEDATQNTEPTKTAA
jgi:hypothetical protein